MKRRAHENRTRKDVLHALRRLEAAMKAAHGGVRGVTRKTLGLPRPQAINHSTVFAIFNKRQDRHIYLEAFVGLCRLVGVSPVAMLTGKKPKRGKPGRAKRHARRARAAHR